jgi:hypothetical protein
MKPFYLFLLLIILAAGCGKHVALSGKVTYSDDGSPLPLGQVCFQNDKTIARGDIKEDGTFQMGSFGTEDGLLPGEYTVFISGAVKEVGIDSVSNTPITAPLLTEKFIDPSKSEIKFNVTGSTKNFDIKVDRVK